MKIETKYNIGDEVWIAYEPYTGNIKEGFEYTGEVAIYTDIITEIAFYDNKIIYSFKHNLDTLQESEIILYNEKDKLFAKIEELIKKIEERENN